MPDLGRAGLRRSWKLLLTPLWPALAALAVVAALLGGLLPRLEEETAAEQLLDSLAVLVPVVAERAAEPAGLHDWVRSLAPGGGLRLTVVAGDGTVIADSARTEGELAAMDNHVARPEITLALATGSGTSVRTSATTGRAYAYAARTFTGPDGQLYVLRSARPLVRLAKLRGRVAATLALAGLIGLGVVALVTWWQARRLFRPLAEVVTGAEVLASGLYDHRLPAPDQPHLERLARGLNRLAGSVEDQIAAARAERDHLGAIVESLTDGVLVTDADGRAVLANRAFRDLFDLAGEVSGRRPLELSRRPELERLVDDTLLAGAGRRDELVLRLSERRTVALTGTALRAERGTAPRGAVVVAHDTTTASRLDSMRRDFVANVSHELKTPLAAIRGYAETLADGALAEPATAERFTDRILDQCRRLQALLDDLLTLSRLEGSEQAPASQVVDLEVVVRRAVDLVADAARERAVTLGVECAAAPRVEGDPLRLERLVVNLLDNAIKYNRAGGRVTVRAYTGDPASGPADTPAMAVLEVEDTGIGIPASARERIFERFYRVDRGRSRTEGGTGLGLAIVKHLAQAHGGRVEVDSTPGEGSTFRVILPRLDRSSTAHRPRRPG